MDSTAQKISKKMLAYAASQLGKTDWYFNLHYYRFLKILNILIKHRKSVKDATVLELGVWPGYLALAMQKAGFNLSGIDINSSRLESAGIQVITDDYDLNSPSLRIPFPDNHFDYIVASEIIEHIDPKNIPHLFSEIDRLLKNNGLAIITTPNRKSLHNLLFSKKIASEEKNGHGHIREYTMPELKKFASNSSSMHAKLKTIDFYSNIGSLPDGKYFYPLKNLWKYPNKTFNLLKFISLPLKKFPTLKDSIIILMQKNG